MEGFVWKVMAVLLGKGWLLSLRWGVMEAFQPDDPGKGFCAMLLNSSLN
jgi:hypothetical protein